MGKGVLDDHGGLSMAEAFDRLRGYARTHNARLSEVARQVIETGSVTASNQCGAGDRTVFWSR